MLSNLHDLAGSLIPDAVKWGFVFVFVGIGTKVGLAPMHTWLPDAHSRTPSPVSGMLSGTLIVVALFAIMRIRGIVDLVLGSSTWTTGFLLVFGTVSVVVPAFILITQYGYKRMLAYSSIEHMGLMTLMLALGPVGMALALLHTVGHALMKSALFFLSGEILLNYHTTKTTNLRNIIHDMPRTGTLFIIALLLLLGVPGSVLFVTELQFLIGLVLVHPLLTAGIAVLLTMVAVSMLRHTLLIMFPGASEEVLAVASSRERWNVTHTVALVQIVAVVALGCAMLTPTGTLHLQALVEQLKLLS